MAPALAPAPAPDLALDPAPTVLNLLYVVLNLKNILPLNTYKKLKIIRIYVFAFLSNNDFFHKIYWLRLLNTK